ncbi:phBC6A51 family helix-turn-helix protein [Cytobacillus gottheilii]|uniref:Helix-turn-helix domain-containing protein n=1 Tax=Cytobacillus gottheilii TaxID=859144 RepID=A0ABX8FG57_9BACI|nr:phBC6A51 family helix-turn-helix protein [Cytobacillus gottheilii]QVY62979.1 helix-turn-helix domain-containing protein [Cytobacillus gottheilii]
MATPRQRELEAKLTVNQQKAALMLVENDLRSTDEKMTQEEIATELGIDRSTLYLWRTRNKNFIDYKNEISDDFLSEHRSKVYSQLLKLINGSQPSVKAIDLYLKRFGLLTEKQVISNDDGSGTRSNDDLAKELEELDELLNDEK